MFDIRRLVVLKSKVYIKIQRRLNCIDYLSVYQWLFTDNCLLITEHQSLNKPPNPPKTEPPSFDELPP